MLQHGILKPWNRTKHLGGLLDNAGVWNHIDDTAFLMFHRVPQCKGQRCQGFSAARRNRERKYARSHGGGATLSQHARPTLIHRPFRSVELSHMCIKTNQQLVHTREAFWPRGLSSGIHKFLRIEKIGIHQTGIEHSDKKCLIRKSFVFRKHRRHRGRTLIQNMRGDVREHLIRPFGIPHLRLQGLSAGIASPIIGQPRVMPHD